MGSRKHKRAEMLKEAKRTQYFASLNDCPSSPQKMRLVANMVRGVDVEKALYILKYSSKEASWRETFVNSSKIYFFASGEN